MNVIVPLSKDDPTSFWLVIGLISIMIGIIVVVLWRAGWIGRPKARPADEAIHAGDQDRGS